jgi:signal transduction histidine kinase
MKAHAQDQHILSILDDDMDQRFVQSVIQAKLEWQQTIDSLPWPLVLTDVDGTIIRANLATAAGDLRKIREIPGQCVSQMVQESGAQVLKDALPVQKRLRDVSLLVNGSPFEAAQLISAPIFGSEGQIYRIVHSLIDQKESYNLRRRLEESNRMSSVGMLASGIAHNLSSPLQAMSGQIELIDMRHDERSDVQLTSREWETVRSQTHRMQGIIGSLLQRLRCDQDANIKPIDLNDLLSRELDFLDANLSYKKKIQKEIQLDPNLDPILALTADLSQAIMNLIDNALDAMHASPTKILTIETKHESDGTNYLRIGDTGPGLSSDMIEQVFEPFFTTKPSMCDRIEQEPCGTGLGLSSSRYLLSRYNVTLDCQSQVGHGANFFLRWTTPS